MQVEEIMAQIRADIEKQGYTEQEMAYFQKLANMDVEEDDDAIFGGKYDALRTAANVPYSYPITGNPIKVFLQKVLRRLSLFAIYPVVQSQNKYNKQLLEFVKLQQKQINALQEQVAQQQAQIAQLQGGMDGRKTDAGLSDSMRESGTEYSFVKAAGDTTANETKSVNEKATGIESENSEEN